MVALAREVETEEHSDVAHPLGGRASLFVRWQAMTQAAWRMMFHDRLKMIGTLFGVVFSVVLSNQQAGTFLGLVSKNTMFIDNCDADLWIVPKDTQALLGGQQLSDAPLLQAKVVPGVAWAEPLLFGTAAVKLPSGSTEAVTLIGTRAPGFHGGPWNLVAGSKDALKQPDTMIFEDSQRDQLGGINLGSVREVNGYKTRVGGFTWGLLPFAPSYAFADFEYAKTITHTDNDRLNYVLIGVQPGQDVRSIQAELQRRIPEAEVVTKSELRTRTVRYVLLRTAIGVTLGSSAAFGLLVGFVIVSLTMFSGVVDNLREFGTLKAIGATTMDLAKLLFVQSITYALMGSIIGLAAVTFMAKGIRSAQLALMLPPELFAGTVVLMMFLCVAASSLALMRLRKLEPAMVFR
jgi:putative ABC transport system permease protein